MEKLEWKIMLAIILGEKITMIFITFIFMYMFFIIS